MNNIDQTRIPTFVINIKRREDRKAHTLKEFEGRPEFRLQIVEALECSNGALGLWSTIRHILLDCMSGEEEFVLIGEDDIEFTEHYSAEYMFAAIDEAKQKSADVLLGGISWFSEAVQISDNLFWADSFTGTHFTIIFKKFYQALINTHFRNTSADFKMVSLSRDILFMHPFAAVQKDFGYSDATQKNNVEGRVASLFNSATTRVQFLEAVKTGYDSVCAGRDLTENEMPSFENILIPTYIITDPDQAECDQDFLNQFNDKPEFDLNFIQRAIHEVEKMGFWLAVRQAVNKAMVDKDDMIIICTERHRFTNDYDRNYFITSIIDSHEDSADLLFGGADHVSGLTPLADGRFWMDSSPPLIFTVIYSKFFEYVLDETDDKLIIEHGFMPYQNRGVSKLLMFPFVSVATVLEQPVDPPVKPPHIPDPLRNAALLNGMQHAAKKYQAYNQTLQKA